MKKYLYENLKARWPSSVRNEVLREVEELICSGFFIGGHYLDRFEDEFALHTGKRYAVGVGSGLAALEIGLSGLLKLGKIRAGSKVYMPSNSYIATILAVKSNGLCPVLVDSKDGILPDVQEYLNVIGGEKDVVILDVPMFGIPRPSKDLSRVCSERGILYLEDLSQAHGGQDIDGYSVGSFSSVQFWSFYPTKNIGGIGESGAITTNSIEYKNIYQALRNYGSAEKYRFEYIGTNGRMDNIQAILLYNYMKNSMGGVLKRKSEIAKYYNRAINNSFVKVPDENFLKGHAFHIYPILCSQFRDTFKNHLDSKGVDTVIHYPIPNHRQKALIGIVNACPRAEEWSEEVLSLPLNPSLRMRDVEEIVGFVNGFNNSAS